MITFGYRNRFTGPLRALLFIALGIVLIITKTNAMELVVKVVAAFILASGIVSFLIGFRKRKDGTMPLFSFNAVLNIVIAVLLFLFSGPASRVISYLVGLTLFGFGMFQTVVLLSAVRAVRGVWTALILPVLVMLAGAFIFFYPDVMGESIGLIAGIALTAYGVSELVASFRMRAAVDGDGTAAPVQEDVASMHNEAKDVEYEKVDEQRL